MDRSIITVTGRDTVGIIAGICTKLAEDKINILDITQTIREGIFNMMMIVDTSSCEIAYDDMVTSLQETATKLGVRVICQKEEIFDKMHRL